MIRALIILGQALFAAGFVAVAFGYATTWYFHGWSALQELLSPFNVWNVGAVLLALAPGYAILRLGRWLERRRAATGKGLSPGPE